MHGRRRACRRRAPVIATERGFGRAIIRPKSWMVRYQFMQSNAKVCIKGAPQSTHLRDDAHSMLAIMLSRWLLKDPVLAASLREQVARQILIRH